MGYQSVNELEQFSFEDCEMTDFEMRENEIYMEVEALIVKPNNSQNKNYTESYAGTTKIVVKNGTITRLVKDGFRYYDANDQLISETEDEELAVEAIQAIVKGQRIFLCEFEKKASAEDGKMGNGNQENGNSGNIYSVVLELAGEDEYDTTPAESYTLTIKGDEVKISWEQYMNRVQR